MSIYDLILKNKERLMIRLITKIESLNESWQGLLVGGLLRTFTGGLTLALIVTVFHYPSNPVHILSAALLMLCVWLCLEFHSWRWIVEQKRSIRSTFILNLTVKFICFVSVTLSAGETLLLPVAYVFGLSATFSVIAPFIAWMFFILAETLFLVFEKKEAAA